MRMYIEIDKMKILIDKFNSEIFGMKMGIIAESDSKVSMEEIEAITDQGKCDGYEHLSIKIPTIYKDVLNRFLTKGYSLVDTQIMYQINIQKCTQKIGNISLDDVVIYRKQNEVDKIHIMNISKDAFRLDQFHSNKLLPRDLCDKYYEQWAKNSCEGFADDVWVLSLKGKSIVIGFITLKYKRSRLEFANDVQSAVVGLAAIDEDYQGRGLFTYMIKKTLEMLEDKKVCLLFYGTQLTNMPVLKTMGHFGGVLVESNHVLHIML